jgi:hypothetical protein
MRLGSSNTTQKENATFLDGKAQNLRDWGGGSQNRISICFSATEEVIHDEFVPRKRSQPSILP